MPLTRDNPLDTLLPTDSQTLTDDKEGIIPWCTLTKSWIRPTGTVIIGCIRNNYRDSRGCQKYALRDEMMIKNEMR